MSTDVEQDCEWLEGGADTSTIPDWVEMVWDRIVLDFCMQKEE